MKIITKLTLAFLIVALLVLMVGYFSASRSQKILQEAIEKNSVILAQETLDKIDRMIMMRAEKIHVYFEDLILKRIISASNLKFDNIENAQQYIDEKDKEWISAGENEVTPFMQEIMNRDLSRNLMAVIDFYNKRYEYPVFGEIFVTNKYGVNIAQSGKTSDYRQDDELWWKIAKEDGIYIGDVGHDESADVYSIDMCMKIDDKTGNFIGVTKAVFNIREISEIIDDVKFKSEHETLSVELFTKDGKIIYGTEGYEILRVLPEEEFMHFTEESSDDYFIMKKEGEGEELVAYAHSKGYKNFKGLGWILIVKYKTKEVLAPAINLRKVLLSISFIIAVLAILLGLGVSRSISMPLSELQDATIKIGSGELNTKIEIKTGDEIQYLADSFNKMTENLKKSTTSVDNLNREIIERKQAEGALRQNEEFFRTTVMGLPLAVFVLDRQGRFTLSEGQGLEILDIFPQKIIGKDVGDVFGNRPEMLSSFKRALNGESSRSVMDVGEYTFQLRCSPFFDKNRKLEGVINIAIDITDRKKAEDKLEEANEALIANEQALKNMLYDLYETHSELKEMQTQLIQSEKLSSIGQLAAGVAHEVRNPLAIILLSAESLKSEISNMSDRNVVHLKMIENATERADKIIKELLGFSRHTDAALEPVNIYQVLSGSIALVENSARIKNIDMIKKYEEKDEIMINADRILLQQVFLNLLTNAMDAIEQTGSITVQTSVLQGARSKDNYVVIDIIDTGSGIPEEHIKRIFEPFYTTKEQGKGTGLGLSTVFMLLEKHRGAIDVKSKQGAGTKFTITLPIIAS